MGEKKYQKAKILIMPKRSLTLRNEAQHDPNPVFGLFVSLIVFKVHLIFVITSCITV